MRLRWALWIALLLSVGVNLGVLVALRRPPSAPPTAPPTAAAPAPEPEPERVEPVAAATGSAPEAPPPAREPRRTPIEAPVRAPQPEPEFEPESEPLPEQAPERLPAPPREPGSGSPPPRFDRVADELELRADQRRAFLELQRRHFEQVRRTRASLDGVRARLAQEFLSGSADRARVEGLLAEAKGHQNELDNLLARMLLESQQILTPEQQRRFSFLVLQRLRGEGPGRVGPRGGDGQPPLRRRPLMRRPPNG